jgi:NADP-reducing hydrogenase subunit HndB
MEKRITDPSALKALREKAQAEVDLRSGPKEIQITVHMGTCGIASGARDMLQLLVGELGKAKIETVTLRQSGCAGLCDQEPMLTLKDKTGKEYRYGRLDAGKVREIIQGHVLYGTPVVKLLMQA